jgi:hypothetical protein
LCEPFDRLDDTAQAIAPIRREVLRDANFSQKFSIGGNDFFRRCIAVKVAQ